MKLRVFTAPDMATAMAQVREKLGEDAVIVSTATDRLKRRVTLTAAIEDEPLALPAPVRLSAAWIEDITSLLRYHGVPEALAGTIVYKSRHAGSLPALARLSAPSSQAALGEMALGKLLEACFSFTPLSFTGADGRLMLVGPPGIGKTLAVAKLATAASLEGASLTVISTDTKRAGGIEQLAAFTDILQLPLHVAATPDELSAHLETAGDSRVLIDSSGCNPYDAADVAELSAFINVGGFEPVLVLPAGMDAHEATEAARAIAGSTPRIRRLIATRADATRRFGSLLAAANAASLAFSHLSGTNRVVGELIPLTPALLAQCLLRYRLQTERN